MGQGRFLKCTGRRRSASATRRKSKGSQPRRASSFFVR